MNAYFSPKEIIHFNKYKNCNNRNRISTESLKRSIVLIWLWFRCFARIHIWYLTIQTHLILLIFIYNKLNLTLTALYSEYNRES